MTPTNMQQPTPTLRALKQSARSGSRSQTTAATKQSRGLGLGRLSKEPPCGHPSAKTTRLATK